MCAEYVSQSPSWALRYDQNHTNSLLKGDVEKERKKLSWSLRVCFGCLLLKASFLVFQTAVINRRWKVRDICHRNIISLVHAKRKWLRTAKQSKGSIQTVNKNCSAWVLPCFQAAPGPAGWFRAPEVDISFPSTVGVEMWSPLKSFKAAGTLSLSTAWAGHWNSYPPITWETSQFRSEQVLNLSHLHPLEIQSTESSLENKQLMMEEEEAAATSE